MPYKPDNPHHEASPSCFHMNVVFDHASQPLAVQSRILSRSLTIAPFNLIRFSPASLLGSRLHSDLDGATAVHLFQGILKVMDREYIGDLEDSFDISPDCHRIPHIPSPLLVSIHYQGRLSLGESNVFARRSLLSGGIEVVVQGEKKPNIKISKHTNPDFI